MAFYGLRQYKVMPGKMNAWVKIMEEEIIPFQVSKGMVICGSFRGETDSSVYVWLRRFESEAEREALYKAVYETDYWKEKIAPRVPDLLDRAAVGRPLLVVDGDSFAHRAYHGLRQSIRRRDGRGGGAIVGFANFLLRLYLDEAPRAVLVGWDTLDAPTWRHRALAGYQSGRNFDPELLDQLDLLPHFVAA